MKAAMALQTALARLTRMLKLDELDLLEAMINNPQGSTEINNYQALQIIARERRDTEHVRASIQAAGFHPDYFSPAKITRFLSVAGWTLRIDE